MSARGRDEIKALLVEAAGTMERAFWHPYWEQLQAAEQDAPAHEHLARALSALDKALEAL